jgi:hypothetical protein
MRRGPIFRSLFRPPKRHSWMLQQKRAFYGSFDAHAKIPPLPNSEGGRVNRTQQLARNNATKQCLAVVPSLLGFPAMFLAVPPLMVRIPAVLPLGVQIVPSAIGLRTVVAMVMNCFIQVHLSLLDGVLALRPLVGVGAWRRYKKHQRRRCYCR